MELVAASCAWTMDADYPGADQELRWKPHVSPGSEIYPAALPESKGRP